MKGPELAALLLALTIGAACQQPAAPEKRYDIHFLAVDDRGLGLNALPIRVGETPIGETDANGALAVQVQAREGQRYPVKVLCPEGYQAMEKPSEVFFRKTRALQGAQLRDIDLRIVCARVTRVAALLVHADGYEGMPILIDGVPQATTGAQGFAHLRLDLHPGAQFQVSLDSSAGPHLVPVNPSQTMSIGQEDGLFIFEPTFRTIVPEKKRTRSRPRVPQAPVAAPKRPVRID